MRWTAHRRGVALALAVAVLVTACTAGDDGTATDDTSGGSEPSAASTPSTPSATGPAPGVTEDTIKVGVTYVDTAALVASGLEYDLGEHEAVYTALFDAINADGGIHGRQIEAVYAPIDPTSTTPAEEACVRLTEDEDVFVITGFFLTDAVNCPVSTHATAVVGGEMTPERLGQAQAPWVTWTPDTDQPATVLRTLGEQGELDGTVGIWAAERDESVVEDVVNPVLEELGVEAVETAIAVAPADDPAAQAAEQATVAERFEAAGIDTVVLVGQSAQGWPTNMVESSYRPQLLFLDSDAPRAFFTNAATTDTTVLEGSLTGGVYGPDQARYEEATMQECFQTITDAGVEAPAPEDVGDDPSNQPYQASFQACPDVYLLRALLEAAGEDLNYGTLEAAIDGLEVALPGDPEPLTFGPAPDADGDPAAYLFEWDEEGRNLVLQEG